MVFEIRIHDDRLHEWGLPKYQTDMAAGIDLHACIEAPVELLPQAPAVLISSGIAVLMHRPDVAAFILPRSGLGHKKGLVLGNGTGCVDADYADICFISAWNRNPPGSDSIVIDPGDRIAQLVFLPIIRPQFRIVDDFSNRTNRGTGGFGSTGVALGRGGTPDDASSPGPVGERAEGRFTRTWSPTPSLKGGRSPAAAAVPAPPAPVEGG